MQVTVTTVNSQQMHVEMEFPSGTKLLVTANYDTHHNEWIIHIDSQEAGADGIAALARLLFKKSDELRETWLLELNHDH